MDSEAERKQFAEEFIRFMRERIPADRRPRLAWVFVSEELDDPAGPVVISAFDRGAWTADFLELMAVRVRTAEIILVRPAPRSS